MHQLAALHSAPWPTLFEMRQDATEKKRALMGLGHDDEDEDEDEEDDDEDEYDMMEDGTGAGAGAGASAGAGVGAGASASGAHMHAHGAPSEAARAREWCADSLVILRALVRERLPAFVSFIASTTGATPERAVLSPAEEAALFAADVYERIVGAFELNNLEVKIDSPLRDYLGLVRGRPDALAVLAPALAQARAARAARKDFTAAIADEAGAEVDELLDEADLPDDEDEDEDEENDGVAGLVGGGGAAGGGAGDAEEDSDDDDVVFTAPDGRVARLPLAHVPVCDGTALFAIICTMNHSCTPNVQVQYDRGTSVGTVVALRDIAAGDELFINYCDMDDPVEIRTQNLRHYGFMCGCEKCARERQG
jgi:hypothetical protein